MAWTWLESGCGCGKNESGELWQNCPVGSQEKRESLGIIVLEILTINEVKLHLEAELFRVKNKDGVLQQIVIYNEAAWIIFTLFSFPFD